MQIHVVASRSLLLTHMTDSPFMCIHGAWTRQSTRLVERAFIIYPLLTGVLALVERFSYSCLAFHTSKYPLNITSHLGDIPSLSVCHWWGPVPSSLTSSNFSCFSAFRRGCMWAKSFAAELTRSARSHLSRIRPCLSSRFPLFPLRLRSATLGTMVFGNPLFFVMKLFLATPAQPITPWQQKKLAK